MAGFSCIAFFWVRSFLLAPVMNLGGGEVVFFNPKGSCFTNCDDPKKSTKSDVFCNWKAPVFPLVKGMYTEK